MSFCRTLVDEWVRAGLTDAVIAPGSRSTPLAVALAERLDVTVVLDERSAAFTALGLGLATGRPAILVCTSGTAATHFHGAVVEASLSNVPMIVCTADRPPELFDVGAPQTIDQNRLYGSAVRWFCAPGVPQPATRHTWRSLGARAVCEATGPQPGPVHLNLAFREPLLEDADEPLPVGRRGDAPWHRSTRARVPQDPPDEVARHMTQAKRPLVITGHLAADGFTARDVPILSDHRGPYVGNVAHWDLLLRDSSWRDAHLPDLIVRSGMPPASKTLNSWLAELDVPTVAIVPSGRWNDPARRADWIIDFPVNVGLCGSPEWLMSWTRPGAQLGEMLDIVCASRHEVSEPGVARAVLDSRKPGSTLVASSSMPIRDLEAFATPRADVRVVANRGANGIDGVTSTAIGVASCGVETTLLIGDLALLHDQNALLNVTGRGIDLTMVVVDNNGGGIFSMLAQHDALDSERFEMLFGTPQTIDLPALFDLHGIPNRVVRTSEDFSTALEWAAAQSGVRALIARTDRDHNVSMHAELAALVDRLAE